MLTTSQLSRARFVRRIGGGAVLLAGGAATGVAAPPASARLAVDEPSEGDLATIRLLASGELLAQAFYTRALASKRLSNADAADAFTRRGRMLRLGTAIETALAGTYASAAATVGVLELRALLAQIAVSEAQHVAILNRLRGGAPAPSFPELFDVEQASAALGPFFGD
jgi:hypothetical protein